METDAVVQLLLTSDSEHIDAKVHAMCRDMTFLKALDCLEQSFAQNNTSAHGKIVAYMSITLGYVESERIRVELEG